MIDCHGFADKILNSITGHGCLAVISVGNDPASQSYIKGKKKDCERVGFEFLHFHYEEDVPLETLLHIINVLNNDDTVTGIIIQLPLPEHLDADMLCQCVAREKDVDGFRPDSPFKPCTPEGIVHILEHELGDLRAKRAVIVGRGRLVGKPLMQMLLDKNMTVCVCHSHTAPLDLQEMTHCAEAVIVAAGVPQHFSFPLVTENAIVIDCGIHRTEEGKLVGDVKSANTNRITPVPGGVGLLTRAMLMKHVERK